MSNDLQQYSRKVQLAKLRDLALDTLHAYGIDEPAKLRNLRYEDNVVYEVVEQSGERHALRLSINEGRSPSEQSAELFWLNSMRSDGLAVPQPRSTAKGDWVLEVETPLLEQPATAVLFAWLEGAVEPPYNRLGVAAKLGSITARMHNNARTLHLPPGLSRPSWNPIDLFEAGSAMTSPNASAMLSAADRTVLAAVAEKVHARLDPLASDQHLIHADLHRENVVFTPERDIAVIDFDDCGFGDPGLDIATVLSSVYRQTRAARPGTYERFAVDLVAAYSAEAPLPPSLEHFSDLLVMRDMVITNLVTHSQNPTVAMWGAGRVSGIMEQMRTFLETDLYPASLPQIHTPDFAASTVALGPRSAERSLGL